MPDAEAAKPEISLFHSVTQFGRNCLSDPHSLCEKNQTLPNADVLMFMEGLYGYRNPYFIYETVNSKYENENAKETFVMEYEDEMGRVMAQVVIRRLLTAEVQVRCQDSPCGICGGQSVTGTNFFSEYFRFPLSVSFHRCSIFTHISPGGCTMGPLAAAVPQRHGLTPS
jgi:hypothetical protein